jgi:NAD(P)-dependent dehydrogenase (short-subunit alcohol dehydrogenase family)
MEPGEFGQRPLPGHVSLITGGNGGIGYGLAVGLLAAGADVAIAGRNEAKTREAADRLRQRFPGRRVLEVTADVSDDEQVTAMVERTVAQLGRVDSCFANAGLSSSARAVWELSADDWRKVMSVNLDGAFYTLRTAAKHMVDRGGGGALVAVSSTSAVHGAPFQPHYATAKTALLGLVRSMAVALARHQVRVNSLLPGWTKTELLAAALKNDKFGENTISRTPVRRHAEPEEFAAVAAFLADPTITFHTGDAMVMDGGYTIF